MTYYHMGWLNEDDVRRHSEARHLVSELDGLVHYFDMSSNDALQIRCGWFSIREEFQWTSEQVSCLNCLARGPRT